MSYPHVLAHMGLWAAWPGHTQARGSHRLCTCLCAHTRARGHTRLALRKPVPGRGPGGRAVGRAWEASSAALGAPSLCQPSARPAPASAAARLSEPRREARNGPRGGPAACGPRVQLSRDSPGQRISPAAGPSARWSLQQGEKTLTRRFKPISRWASGEPQRAPDNPICCE